MMMSLVWFKKCLFSRRIWTSVIEEIVWMWQNSIGRAEISRNLDKFRFNFFKNLLVKMYRVGVLLTKCGLDHYSLLTLSIYQQIFGFLSKAWWDRTMWNKVIQVCSHLLVFIRCGNSYIYLLLYWYRQISSWDEK